MCGIIEVGDWVRWGKGAHVVESVVIENREPELQYMCVYWVSRLPNSTLHVVFSKCVDNPCSISTLIDQTPLYHVRLASPKPTSLNKKFHNASGFLKSWCVTFTSQRVSIIRSNNCRSCEPGGKLHAQSFQIENASSYGKAVWLFFIRPWTNGREYAPSTLRMIPLRWWSIGWSPDLDKHPTSPRSAQSPAC